MALARVIESSLVHKYLTATLRRGRHIVTSLKDYITRQNRRTSRTSHHPMREEVGDVSFTRSPGLDAGSVALPAGIDLDDRATRMNEFWRA